MLVTYKLEFGGAVGALVFFVVLYKCCIRLMSFRSKSTKPQEEYVSYIRKQKLTRYYQNGATRYNIIIQHDAKNSAGTGENPTTADQKATTHHDELTADPDLRLSLVKPSHSLVRLHCPSACSCWNPILYTSTTTMNSKENPNTTAANLNSETKNLDPCLFVWVHGS